MGNHIPDENLLSQHTTFSVPSQLGWNFKMLGFRFLDLMIMTEIFPFDRPENNIQMCYLDSVLKVFCQSSAL